MKLLRELFSFETFIFPKVAKILFILGSVAIALLSLISIVTIFASWGSFGEKLGMALVTLLGGAFSIVGLRIATELALVLFSIDKSLKTDDA